MRWSGLCLLASLVGARPALADEPMASDAELVTLARSLAPTNTTQRMTELARTDRCADAHDQPACSRVSGGRRAAAIALSATTGLFIRGVGSYLVGEKRTAKRLAMIGGIGLGAAAAGGLPVGISGGYPPTMPFMPLLLLGSGALFTTWWADVGVAAGAPRAGTARTASPWSIEFATLYLSDPYRQTGLGRLGGNVEIGRITIGASGLIDAENELRTGELDTSVRILGAAATGEAVEDGSRLRAHVRGRSHEDDGDHVSIITGEVELVGRLDLHHLDRALHGSFIQLSTGLGVERIAYTGDHDNGSILLGTFGWGLYLGDRGELSIFYDHRRDSMAGGLAAGRAAGFVGSVGGSLDWMFDRQWGAHLEIDVGNAWLTTLALRFRGGTP